MYFQLHIHKLYRLITRRALVSETTNIISCDAPTPPPKLWFVLLIFVTYLGQMEFETRSEYPGNCNRIPKQGNAANHYYPDYGCPTFPPT